METGERLLEGLLSIWKLNHLCQSLKDKKLKGQLVNREELYKKFANAAAKAEKAIDIICGQRINERHYHILAKQELTKEYIVEDREVNKDVTELDPSHVTELRVLGLY